MDVMYVFDEPSVGMHPRDVHRMNELLQKLRDKGNTVLVVEHDDETIREADWIVPRARHFFDAAMLRVRPMTAVFEVG